MLWRSPTISVRKIDTLVAFSFGNRILANGNRTPGPVNQSLADIAARLQLETGVRVIAQWEIAEAIGPRVPASSLLSIFPARDARAEPIYLSTQGVLDEIKRIEGHEPALGKVGIVAFSDHLYRCVSLSRRLGLDAYGLAEIKMPSQYDPESGQPWCRNRIAYLLHDIMSRIEVRLLGG